MNYVRLGITAVEAAGCMGAVKLAEAGYLDFGFLLAIATVMLGWFEGRCGWGRQYPEDEA